MGGGFVGLALKEGNKRTEGVQKRFIVPHSNISRSRHQRGGEKKGNRKRGKAEPCQGKKRVEGVKKRKRPKSRKGSQNQN